MFALIAFIAILPCFALRIAGNVQGLQLWWQHQTSPYLQGGEVLLEERAYLPGQSLTATAYRLLSAVPSTAEDRPATANVADLAPQRVQSIVRVLELGYLAVLVLAWRRARRRGWDRWLVQISLTICVALCLAPLIHKAHMVWLLLPYTVLLAQDESTLSSGVRSCRRALIALSVLLIGATTPALLGRTLATWQLAHNAIFFGLQCVLAALLVSVFAERHSAAAGAADNA